MTPHRTRTRLRAVIASAVALGAALALAACSAGGSDAGSSSSSAPVTTLNYQTSWIPLVQFGGSYVAEKRGYFADQHLKVDILPGGPDVDGMALLASGKADIALSNADVVARANEQGADLVIIAAGFQKSPLAIMSKASDPINKPSDLIGKKIGVPSGDEATHAAFLAVNGIDPSKVTSVPVGFDVAPTQSGQVDGQYVFATEQPIALESAGVKPATMLLADHKLNVYAQVYVVTRQTLEKKRAAIEGFLRAEIKGWQDYVKDPTEAVELTVNDYGKAGGLEIAEQTKQAQLQMQVLETPTTKAHGLLWMSSADIAANLRTIKALGITADKSLFDTSVLKDVYDGASSIK
jgi:ABC-type nitrate/sulfonate/bicarbonate transport system substrate-binding protein